MSCVPHVIVCGGGIVGASSAYFLTLKGVEVTVIEKSGIACAASGKAGGFLARGWGGGSTRPLHEMGFDLHKDLAVTLNIESYRSIRTLQYEPSGKVGKGSPSWIKTGRSSVMDNDTAQVTPFELTTKLMDAAKARGAKVVFGDIKEFLVDGKETKKVTGVMVGDQKIEGSSVLISTGPWAGVTLAKVGVRLPMSGMRSTSVVFKNVSGVEEDPFALFCGEDVNDCHLEVYPRPGKEGEVYLCGCGGSEAVQERHLREGGKYDTAEKVVPKKDRAEAASKSFTTMLGLPVTTPSSSQACLRPLLPDALPAMGLVDKFSNLYVCAGHNCWGILWGPISGKLMAATIYSEGNTEEDKAQLAAVHWSAFSPNRF